MTSEYPAAPPPNVPPSPNPPPLPPAPPAAPPPPLPTAVPTRKAETGCAFWIVAALAVLFFVSTVLLLLALVGVAVGKGGLEVRGGAAEEQLVEQTVQGEGTNKILLIPISGVIAELRHRGSLRRRNPA